MSNLDAWFLAVSEELITYGADAAPSPAASLAGGVASRGAGSRVVEVLDSDSDIEVIGDDSAANRKRAANTLMRSKKPIITALRRRAAKEGALFELEVEDEDTVRAAEESQVSAIDVVVYLQAHAAKASTDADAALMRELLGDDKMTTQKGGKKRPRTDGDEESGAGGGVANATLQDAEEHRKSVAARIAALDWGYEQAMKGMLDDSPMKTGAGSGAGAGAGAGASDTDFVKPEDVEETFFFTLLKANADTPDINVGISRTISFRNSLKSKLRSLITELAKAVKIEHAELLRDKSLFIAEIPGIDLLTDKDENAPLHSLGIHLRNSGERTAKSGKGGSEVLKVLSLQLMDKAKTDAEILRLIFQTDDKGTTKSHSLLMPIDTLMKECASWLVDPSKKGAEKLGFHVVDASRLVFKFNGTTFHHNSSVKSQIEDGEIEPDDLIMSRDKRQITIDVFVRA